MNYILISDNGLLSNKIKGILEANLEDNDKLRVVSDEYEFDNKTKSETMVLNTVSSKNAKNLCLKTEDLNILTVDFTDMFVEDSTIPVISNNIGEISSNSYIFRVPNEYSLYLINPIKKILDEYKIKSISICIYENRKFSDTLENIISSDIATLLDFSELITTNILDFTQKKFIHIFFEFYRPFNINNVKEEIEDHNTIRVSRDLSVNSGLNIWLNTNIEDNESKIFNIIKRIKEHIN